jgi:hypothetical protein
MSDDTEDEASADDRYAYKASLIGSAHVFELTKKGLSWKVGGGRSGVWAYTDIAAINLSYRPSSMQSRRFRADIRHVNGGRLKVMSTTWQTVSLMTPQDHGYRAFITALHGRMAAAGSRAKLSGGLSVIHYGAAMALLAFLAVAMVGLLVRAVAIGEWAGVLFLLGFAALFVWQIGGFVRRNQPITYSFDQLPKALQP